MCRTQCVLALLALGMGLAHSFSWDIVLMSTKDGLEFYDNETLTHTEHNFTQNRISLINYDPRHNRVLFTNTQHNFITFVYSFDITTRKLQHLASSSDGYIETLTYDLATDTLFWLQGKSIFSFSLKPGSINEVNGNFLTKLDGTWPREFVVDSCGGFIYWIYLYTSIKRSRLNGDEKELIIDGHDNVHIFLCGLTIDQQTRKLYWIADDFDTNPMNYTFSLKCADLNGKNIRTLYEIKTKNVFCLLAVSKDFIYWGSKRTTKDKKSYWQLEKNPSRHLEVSPKEISTTAYRYMAIAANYATEDQTQGIQDCEALKSNNSSINVSTGSLLCVHGTKVSGKSDCECTQGYTGERCDVSVCQNYCVRGDCSVSDEGKPKCRCNAGYSGDMCEVTRCSGDCLNNGACWSRNRLCNALIISIFLAMYL